VSCCGAWGYCLLLVLLTLDTYSARSETMHEQSLCASNALITSVCLIQLLAARLLLIWIKSICAILLKLPA
jgi:hypothetical protein